MSAKTIFALLSVTAAAACGSYQSAPIVYGTDPNWRPQTQTAAVRAEAPASLSRTYAAPTSGAAPIAAVERQELAQLIPASATPADTFGDDAFLEQSLDGGQEGPIATASGMVVRVRKGDTVYAISRRTGASPQEIIALNDMRPPYALSIGQLVRVPGASVSRSRAKPAKIAKADPPAKSARSSTNRAVGAPAVLGSITPVTPSTEKITRRADVKPTTRRYVHHVRKGDTLYSISRKTGVSVRQIASANGMAAPYALSIGDEIVVPGADRGAAAARQASVRRASRSQATSSPTTPDSLSTRPTFDWPVKGPVVGKFERPGDGVRNDGIDIAAPVGTPVRAAADGEVVYRGSELEGYGNLLLVRHADGFVTAYAHNDVMLVRKGQLVRQGQVIAKVGATGDAGEPQLHFEIRENLKAVDPMSLLR